MSSKKQNNKVLKARLTQLIKLREKHINDVKKLEEIMRKISLITIQIEENKLRGKVKPKYLQEFKIIKEINK